jgi:protein-tyrosine phosphatase
MAIAARPRGGDWLEDEIIGWRLAGIDIVVSLLESHEADDLDLLLEPHVAEANSMRFVSFPIPDRGVPGPVSAAIALMAEVASALKQGKNVAVHCRQGIGRSGLIAAAILSASGVSPENSIQAVSAARGIPVPEASGQVLWLQRLPALTSF